MHPTADTPPVININRSWRRVMPGVRAPESSGLPTRGLHPAARRRSNKRMHATRDPLPVMYTQPGRRARDARRYVASFEGRMKISRAVTLAFVLLAPHISLARTTPPAERAWKPFFAAFRAAAKRRDREALKRMMPPDFFTSGGIGDDNGDGDSRDEAFAFWDKPYTRGWDALDRVLAQGVVTNTAWPDSRNPGPSQVAPPVANSPKAIRRASSGWHAVFQFRGGRWYCVVFAECCD